MGDAVYRQGILNRDATDWDTPLGPAEGDVPDYEGLYLYSRGKGGGLPVLHRNGPYRSG